MVEAKSNKEKGKNFVPYLRYIIDTSTSTSEYYTE